MSWFKEEVEDWDLVGKTLQRKIETAPTKDEYSHHFNPSEVETDEDGNLVVVVEAVDSKEVIEMDDLDEIEITAQNLRSNPLAAPELTELLPKE